jgi:hypothetical protein
LEGFCGPEWGKKESRIKLETENMLESNNEKILDLMEDSIETGLTELLMKFCQQCLINRKISYHKLSNNNT